MHIPTIDREETIAHFRQLLELKTPLRILRLVGDPNLTRCFVGDLQQLNARTVVLIFDQMDNAAPETQAWLMETLLVQLQRLAHVRVVVGGRRVPEALGSYALRCRDYELALPEFPW